VVFLCSEDIYLINNNRLLKKHKMAKVLRYNEEEFVTLLENIVKRVKKEQMLEEARKNRKSNLSENFNRLRERRSRN